MSSDIWDWTDVTAKELFHCELSTARVTTALHGFLDHRGAAMLIGYALVSTDDQNLACSVTRHGYTTKVLCEMLGTKPR